MITFLRLNQMLHRSLGTWIASGYQWYRKTLDLPVTIPETLLICIRKDSC